MVRVGSRGVKRRWWKLRTRVERDRRSATKGSKYGGSRPLESSSSSVSKVEIVLHTTQVHLCLSNQPLALDRQIHSPNRQQQRAHGHLLHGHLST